VVRHTWNLLNRQLASLRLTLPAASRIGVRRRLFDTSVAPPSSADNNYLPAAAHRRAHLPRFTTSPAQLMT